MYKHLLIPTDGSELSAKAVENGIMLAQNLGARVTFVYVQPEFPIALLGETILLAPESREQFARNMLKQAQDILGEAVSSAQKVGVSAQSETCVSDYPFQVIVKTAEEKKCDLILMASHGRKGLSGLLLASETHKVLTHTTVPVLVYR